MINQLELYREFYYKEIERKNQISADLSLPIAIGSILATGIFFYISNFDFECNFDLLAVFIVMLGGSIFFLLRGIYFLLKSFNLWVKKIPFQYLAYPTKIDNYFQQYRTYFLALGQSTEDATRNAEVKLNEFLIERYIKTASENMVINDKKAENLFICKRQMLYCLSLLLFTFIPFIFNYFNKHKEIQKIEITNLNNYNKKKVTMIPDRDTIPPPQPVPTPPTPPADRGILEGDNSIRP